LTFGGEEVADVADSGIILACEKMKFGSFNALRDMLYNGV
jgi:hypothetical protein